VRRIALVFVCGALTVSGCEREAARTVPHKLERGRGEHELPERIAADDELCTSCRQLGARCVHVMRYDCTDDRGQASCGAEIPCDSRCCAEARERGFDEGPWAKWMAKTEGPIAPPVARLSWVARAEDDHRLMLEGLGEEGPIELARWQAELGDHAWSHDGRYVFAIEHGRGDDHLRALDLGSRRWLRRELELGPLTGLSVGPQRPVLSEAGNPVVLLDTPDGVWRIELGEDGLGEAAAFDPTSVPGLRHGSPQTWTGEFSSCLVPSWHPSGLFYACWSEPGPTLQLVAADGRSWVQSSLRGRYFDPGEPSPVVFAPGGRHLAFTRYEDRHTALARLALVELREPGVDAETEAREPVAKPEVVEFAWAPAGVAEQLDGPGLPVPAPK
jgi:hypothetical protein